MAHAAACDVKNTFLHVHEDLDDDGDALDFRHTQSVPFSFGGCTSGGGSAGLLQISFADALGSSDFREEDDEGEESGGACAMAPAGTQDNSCRGMSPTASYEVLADSPTGAFGNNSSAMSERSSASRKHAAVSRVRAVRFFTPCDSSKLFVKNTFLQVADNDPDSSPSPAMRSARSVPVTFAAHAVTLAAADDGTPGVAPSPYMSMQATGSTFFPCGGGSGDESPASQRTMESQTVVPADFSLHPLALNRAAPAGPHLGLLWAPDGHAWGPQDGYSMAQIVPLKGAGLGSPRRIGGQACGGGAGGGGAHRIRLAAELPVVGRGGQAEAAPVPHAVAHRVQLPGVAPVVSASVTGPGAADAGGDEIWALAMTQAGCREVQDMLDRAPDDEARYNVAFHLRGHVLEAMWSPYANFVVAKAIKCLPADRMQFILDEVMGQEDVTQAAKHKFGCRIVQRLFESCGHAQIRPLACAVLRDFDELARHPYGNYVIQNLLDNGEEDLKGELFDLVEREVRSLAMDCFGCTVIAAALDERRPRERARRIAAGIVADPGLLMFTACSRHGHTAVARLLQVLDGEELRSVRAALQAEMETLRCSRFGRNLVDLVA